jgi:hypothetical protein
MAEVKCANFGDFSYQVKASFHPILKLFIEKVAETPQNYATLLQTHQNQAYKSEDDPRFLLYILEKQWKMVWHSLFPGYATLGDSINKTIQLFHIDAHSQNIPWFDLHNYVQASVSQ